MAIELDGPENFDQEGNGLREAGKYHCLVLAIDESPSNKEGKLIDNAVFKASLAVLDGTTPGQRDKQFDLIFFAPKMTHKDHGEMAKKKIWFFSSAIGCGEIVTGKMRLDFAQAGGRQCCIEVEMQESKTSDGKVYQNPGIRFCNVYHVDNPAVADWPKDAAALSLLPPSLRKKPEEFAKPKPGASPSTATTPPTKPQTPPGGVNLDDL